MRESITPILERLHTEFLGVREEMLRAFSSIDTWSGDIKFSRVTDSLPDFTETIKNLESGEKALNDAGYGYTVSFWTTEVIQSFVEIDETDRAKTISSDIINFTTSEEFENKLKILFTNSPILQKRWRLVESGLELHKSQNYAASIPTLLPQLEGICNDVLVARGVAMEVAGRIYLVAPNGSRGGELKGLDSKFTQAGMKANLEEEVKSFVVSSLAPDRNPILHGTNTTYDHVDTSVHILLLILKMATVVTDIES